jgi:HK97 family phage portal protein
MGILARAVGRWGAPQATAGTAGPYSPLDPELAYALGGARSRSGIPVGSESALNSPSVFACVRVIAEDVGTIGLHLYQKGRDGSRQRATDHPLYDLLHLTPNSEQTTAEFREMMQGHIELRAQAFARITRYRNEIRELIPLHPDGVEVKRDARGRRYFRYDRSDFPASDILHVQGYSPVKRLVETIALEMAVERHGALQFGNGSRPGGVLEHPLTMSEEAQKRLKKQVVEASSGDNQHKLVLLEEGMKWHQVGLSNEDAQFIETRKLSRSVIAGAFRIPPHLIGDLERATFTNIEHQGIEYIARALMGRLTRWQQRLNMTLLTPAERREFYFEFDPNSLVKGDIKTRFEAYGKAIQDGWMNRNEARTRENMNPEPGLDDFLVPLNMRGAGDEEE